MPRSHCSLLRLCRFSTRCRWAFLSGERPLGGPTGGLNRKTRRSPMSMSLYWTKAARSMWKYQLGLMLALVSSSVTPSPVQAGLDEKSEVLAEWLIDPKAEDPPDSTPA